MLLRQYLEGQRKRQSRSKTQRERLWRIHSGRCWYCGESVPITAFILEHLHPFGRGGSNTQSNLVVSCWQCDRAKGHLTLEEFRTARGGIRFDGEKRGIIRRGRVVRPVALRARKQWRERVERPEVRMVKMVEAFERAGFAPSASAK